MLAILLALASAFSYGGSDFAAGLASRRISVMMVSFLAASVSLLLTLAVLPAVAAAAPTLEALTWGAVAGLGGMGGAIALYLGFRRAEFSVAGPLSAVSAAGLSVIVGVLLGERPSALSLTGIGIALPAIVLVSLTAGPAASAPSPGPATPGRATPGRAGPSASAGRKPLPGVASGLAAGVGFALLFIGLDRAGSASGLWPVLSGQVAEVLVLGVVLIAIRGFGNHPLGTGRPLATATLALLTGLTGGAGTILYFLATHHGFLAITAVLTSLYPAVTIALARLLASEKLSAARLAGLVLAGLAVTLIALGGAS
jgi:drug/metabolite transporter (DMT)-like permease